MLVYYLFDLAHAPNILRISYIQLHVYLKIFDLLALIPLFDLQLPLLVLFEGLSLVFLAQVSVRAKLYN